MVKFLFAKEKMRVQFPLSAQGNGINVFNFNRIKKYKEFNLSIVDHNRIVVLSSSLLFLPPTPKEKKKNY